MKMFHFPATAESATDKKICFSTESTDFSYEASFTIASLFLQPIFLALVD